MSTIGAVEMASKTKQQADAELEELDVREVSIVDRPANKRKFLIVKRDAGLNSEEDMPDKTEVVTKEDDGLLDLLGLGSEEDEGEFDHRDGITTLDDDPVLEAITKASVDQVAKVVAALVGKLSRVVSKLKGGAGSEKEQEKAEVPDAMLAEIVAIADKLMALADAIAGGEGGGGGSSEEEMGDKKEKADSASVLKATSAALSRLMSVATKLKSIDKGSDIPTAISAELKAIAAILSKLASKPGAEGGKEQGAEDADKKKATKKNEPPFQVFVTKGNDDDPEIIVKAGAKMKRVRLNQFKKAVETLMSLLKELEGDQGGDKDAKDKKGVKKSEDGDSLGEKLAKGFELLESKIAEAIKTALEPITKRVDELENTVPAGNGDSDATEVKTEEVKKKDAGFWSSVFNQ